MFESSATNTRRDMAIRPQRVFFGRCVCVIGLGMAEMDVEREEEEEEEAVFIRGKHK